MAQNQTARKRGASRVIKRILMALCALIAALAIVVFALWGGELSTLKTLSRVEDDVNLFTMEYKADYALDEFLKAGASTDAELVDFIVRQMLKGIPLNFDLPNLGCSTFAAQLTDGTPIFGRNFDMYDSPALFVTTRPKDGYASISMVNLAYIGYNSESLPTSLTKSIMTLAAPYAPLDGVNEKGLAVGVLQIKTTPTNQQTDKVDITTTSAIRLLLDRAATVEEAVELLSQYDMHASAGSCYHFHIADAKGGSVIVEYIDDEMSVVQGDAATNFLLTPGEYDFGTGEDRYAVLRETLDANGGVFESEEQAMELLKAVSQPVSEEKKSSTQWSCVYNQQDAGVEIAMNMDYEKVYTFGL